MAYDSLSSHLSLQRYLRKLGSSIIDFVKREAMQAAVKGILKYTALRGML